MFLLKSIKSDKKHNKLKNFRRLIIAEKKEFSQLLTGKETSKKFFKDSGNLLKDFFIPYSGNNHKPKILRSDSLASYAIIAIIVKMFTVGFLFLAYPNPAQLSSIVASNIINLTNQSRLDSGLNKLSENSLLSSYALAKAEDMMNRNYFSHDTPEGKHPWQWINRGEYDYIYAGENMAMDFISAETVQAAYLKSPSHRQNILNSNYQDIGVAVLHGELNNKQTTLLVVFFATKRSDLLDLGTKPAIAINNDNATFLDTDLIEQPTVAGVQTIVQDNKSNDGVVHVAATQKSGKSVVDFVVEYSNIFFLAFLFFILISLVANIIIKAKIQHPTIILQSLAVVSLLAALLLAKIHFIEKVTSQLLIL
ncbi:MAG: hypothetical protein CMI53_04740 [Parcubacteria group bacterium]|nr:hypothetical protein [Parcubacteria group bacterium]|tara:strand:+ start:3451 stop:4545 length:1095 start_codon:yes stop_codon:yes gene_type:complete